MCTMDDKVPTTDKERSFSTVADYLYGCVNFEIPDEAVDYVCSGREIAIDTPISDAGRQNLDLLRADLYTWIVLGPGSVNNTSDTDNGYTHSGGGYSMSKDDKSLLLSAANAIYSKYDEPTVGKKTTFKINSFGIRRADIDPCGMPLPHIIR